MTYDEELVYAIGVLNQHEARLTFAAENVESEAQMACAMGATVLWDALRKHRSKDSTKGEP